MKIIPLNETSREQFVRQLQMRSADSHEKESRIVADIIARVKADGDAALFAYAAELDHCKVDASNVRLTRKEIDAAYEQTDPGLIRVMKKSADNIRAFHEKQRRTSWIDTRADGVILGQRIIPMDITGVYVPGGKAAYPSSVLMNVIPAAVAGVKRIIMCTPDTGEGISPATLAAADIAGVTEIYRVGGAQAIAAMAYGTASVPKVDKITGPGNIYVALAKKMVFGDVSIDSIAGPSEILVLADESADARYVAADLLSQAEHDEMASATLITTDMALAEAVVREIDAFLPGLSRREIIEKSLDGYGAVFVADTMDEAIDAVNTVASEHLEILTKDPMEVMTKIRHAGAIFLGAFSSEPLGDYFAGPNHILPTGGTARFFSPLNVDDFTKKSSIISYSREALEQVHEDIERFAQAEGLTAHANSIRVRFE